MPPVPAWAVDAGPRDAFLQGLRTLVQTPAMVLLFGALGFGALARDLGFTAGHAAFMSAVVYALPAQVVLVDQIARGASLIGTAFAVSLTAIRMLPMTVVLMPLLRQPGTPRWWYVGAVHMVAVTAWIEGLQRLPHLPAPLRLPYFFGIAFSCTFATICGSVLGYYLAASVPVVISAAFLFLTPLYFILSMISTARTRPEYLAIALGVVLGPPLYILVPGFDLLVAGIVGGTIAFLIEKRAAA